MRIHDISIPIRVGMAVWPGDPAIDIRPHLRISAGDTVNVACIHLGSHTGTHVDAPLHFRDGADPLDRLSLEVLVGPAQVVELSQDGAISAADLAAARLREGITRLLIKTPNSDRFAEDRGRFRDRYTHLSGEAAGWLISGGVRLIGVDGMSVDGFEGEPDAHRALLSAGIVILEGLDLSGVEPGAYQLLCLPLKLSGVDGAPARAILIDAL